MKRSMKPLTQLATQSLDYDLGARACELFLCFAPFVFLRSIVLTSLFPLFYVTCEYVTARMSPEYFGSLVSGDSVALFSRSKKLKEKSDHRKPKTVETKLVSSEKIVQT